MLRNAGVVADQEVRPWGVEIRSSSQGEPNAPKTSARIAVTLGIRAGRVCPEIVLSAAVQRRQSVAVDVRRSLSLPCCWGLQVSHLLSSGRLSVLFPPQR